MIPAIILAALTSGEPAPPMAEPQCFPSAIQAALFLGGWGEALTMIEPVDDVFRLTFIGPRTWTQVHGKTGAWCITGFGDNL